MIIAISIGLSGLALFQLLTLAFCKALLLFYKYLTNKIYTKGPLPHKRVIAL
jgi:hypothetical protein